MTSMSPDPASDSGTLLHAAQTGDEPALGMLLARHAEPLRAFVRLQISPFLRQLESESDILQQVCCEVIRRESRFDYRGETAFRSWLFGAVLQQVRDRERFYKMQKRDPGKVEPLDTEALSQAYHSISPSRQAMAKEQIEQLEAAFTRLPERYARVLTLHCFVGLERSELARELDVTEDTASTLLRRAKVRLSRELESSEA